MAMKNIILGTAGHIDHGKTAFVRALTGIECDRLEEEKRRGITIVLGYAHLSLPSGIKVGIVDVPGHERFVNRMVAGAAGIDVVALLVAADEGIKPQTREHLYICEILGIKKGIVVLNKKDLADEELLFLQREEIAQLTTGTFLADAPIIPVSSVTGEGVAEFVSTLDLIAAEIAEKPAAKPFRLPVDAVASITGFGAVVRGTAISGRIAVGEEVEVLPGGFRSPVRGLQNHGRDVTEGGAGERLAINLADLKTEDLSRGMVVVRPDTFPVADSILVEYQCLPGNKNPLKPVVQGRFLCLAAKVNARMELLGKEKPLPGSKAVAVVTTARPIAVAAGDRFVMRGYDMFSTIGGGRVLYPTLTGENNFFLSSESLRILTGENLKEKINLCVRGHGARGFRRNDLRGVFNETGAGIDKCLRELKKDKALYEDDGGRLYHRDAVLALRREIGATLAAYHRRNYLRLGMGREELFRKTAAAPELFQLVLNVMLEEGRIDATGELVMVKDFKVARQDDANILLVRIEDMYRRYGLQPDKPAAGAENLNMDRKKFQETLDTLARSGRLVRISTDHYLHPEHLERFRSALEGFFEKNAVLTPPDVRDLFGISRRYIIPLMEYLDGIKFTFRTPEGRKMFIKGRSH